MPRRARELGIVIGSTPAGPLNALTDVAGVRVGHTTIVEGDSIRTGVTAVVPDQLNRRRSLPAGLMVGNGYGKMGGSTQVAELGEMETPVVLTYLSTFPQADPPKEPLVLVSGRARRSGCATPGRRSTRCVHSGRRRSRRTAGSPGRSTGWPRSLASDRRRALGSLRLVHRRIPGDLASMRRFRR
jgi:Peptidase family S58